MVGLYGSGVFIVCILYLWCICFVFIGYGCGIFRANLKALFCSSCSVDIYVCGNAISGLEGILELGGEKLTLGEALCLERWD